MVYNPKILKISKSIFGDEKKDIKKKIFLSTMSRIWFSDDKHGWLLGNIVSGTSSTGYDIISADCNPNAVCTS